jgi:hypothetical protein
MDFLRVIINAPAGSRQGPAVDNPVVHLRNVAGKISDVTSLLMQIGSLAIVAAAVLVTADQVARLLIGDTTNWFAINWFAAIDAVLSSRALQLILLVVAIVVVRRVMIRLKGPDKFRTRGRRSNEMEP